MKNRRVDTTPGVESTERRTAAGRAALTSQNANIFNVLVGLFRPVGLFLRIMVSGILLICLHLGGAAHDFLGIGPRFAAGQDEILDEAAIRQEMDEILGHPDFRRLKLTIDPPEIPKAPKASFDWLEKLIDWFRPNVSFSGGWEIFVTIIRCVVVLIIAALAALIIWLVVKAINRWQLSRKEKLEGLPVFAEGAIELPPGDIPSDEYLRRAKALAQQGQFHEAIAQLLLGAMSAAERGGLIRFRRGLTYRDYVRALRKIPDVCEAFRSIVGIYLPIGFGRRPAYLSQFESALTQYELAFMQPLTPPKLEEPATGSEDQEAMPVRPSESTITAPVASEIAHSNRSLSHSHTGRQEEPLEITEVVDS